MDPEIFVHEVSENFICSICLLVVLDPVEHTDCDRAFCRACIASLQQPYCPNCRSSLHHRTRPMHRVLRNLVYDQLLIKCRHPSCTETIPLCQYLRHDSECSFNLVSCEYCQFTTQSSMLQLHQDETCDMIPIVCRVPGCGQRFLRAAMNEHRREFALQHEELYVHHINKLEHQLSQYRVIAPQPDIDIGNIVDGDIQLIGIGTGGGGY